MSPFPSCDVLDPSKRQEFLRRFSIHQGGGSNGMDLKYFWYLAGDIGTCDAIRCAFVDNTPDLPGVYVLWHEDEVVYVGRSSSSMLKRVTSHRQCKQFDRISAMHDLREYDESEIPFIESFLIFHLTPKYNRCMDTAEVYMEVKVRPDLDIENGLYNVRVSCVSGRLYADFPMTSSEWDGVRRLTSGHGRRRNNG